MQLVNNINDAISALMGKAFSATHDEEGQTLVEYGLIVALLSIAAIAVLALLGGSVKDVFDKVRGELDSAAG